MTDLIVEIERLAKNQKGVGSKSSGLTKVNLRFSLIKKKNLLSATLTFYQNKVIIR